MSKNHSTPGPKSIAGKRKVSKNALKTGATSQNFLNDQEEKRFHEFYTQLKRDYPYKNSLIEAQIIRISKTRVQLERIQNIMDAEFAKSRALSNSIESTTDLLKMTNAEKSLIAKFTCNVIDAQGIPEVLDSVGQELITLAIEYPSLGINDLMLRAPHLSHYIYHSAESQGLPINEWIDQELNAKNSAKNSTVLTQAIFAFLQDKIHEDRPKDLASAIKSADITKLNQLIQHMSAVYYRELTLDKKISDYYRLQPIVENSAMPDLDLLDRLMRYQTALQNHLSKFIGELLSLVDREKTA